MNTVSTLHIALICLHAHAWLNLCLPSTKLSHSVFCLAPCHTTCTARLHCWPQFCFHPLHLLFLAQAQSRFNPEHTAPIQTALGVTFFRNQNFAQVISPTGVSTALSRSSLSKRLSTLHKSQIPEIEDKFSLPYNQSLLSSTQDSFESLATPQEADLDDEQIRALVASPWFLPEREASAERSQIDHSQKRRFAVKFITKSELHRHRETCGMALTSEKIGTRRIFRKRATCWCFKE